MLKWWKRQVRCAGAVLFPGSLPPTAGDMAVLKRIGFDVAERKLEAGEFHWRVEATSAELGKAVVVAMRNPPRLPRELVEWAVELTDEERQEAVRGDATVGVMLEGRRENLLRDRKTLLKLLGAIMGRDGVIAVDNTAQRFWSRQALDDELLHEADVDVEALYILHAVGGDEDGSIQWLHTHGLAEIGLFDFDLIRPHKDFVVLQTDAVRALALAIAEGRLLMDGRSFDVSAGAPVRAVEAATFEKRAAPHDRSARSMKDDHMSQRAVICEPGGWLSRLRGVPRPARFFQSEPSEGTLLNFSSDAGMLMARRARGSLPALRRLMQEFEEFSFPALVKLGYGVDGGHATALEHMWFSLNEFGDQALDATLEVNPIGIARMKKGDRAKHSLDRLTDWLMLTPAGPVTPRSTTAARIVRARSDNLRQALRDESAQAGQPDQPAHLSRPRGGA